MERSSSNLHGLTKYFLDTESCGFLGPCILIQYAIENEEPILHEVWREPVTKTLDLLRAIASNAIIGFNLAHDWYQLFKLHCLWTLLFEKYGDIVPLAYVDEVAALENEARFGKCLKPASALDLMLHARKGPYQTTMQRKPIYIRRVHPSVVNDLIEEIKDRLSEIRPIHGLVFKQVNNRGLVDIKLEFSPSTSLKAIIKDLGLNEGRDVYVGLSPPKSPSEIKWMPHYTGWKRIISEHFAFWHYNKRARKYAIDDVQDTRALYHAFGCPPIGDDDSTLACMVGAIRYRGYAINMEAIREEYARLEEAAKAAPVDQARSIAFMGIEPDEIILLRDKSTGKITTNKVKLEEIAGWTQVCSCYKEHRVKKNGHYALEHTFDPACDCTNGFRPHPAAAKARSILDARQSRNKRALLAKLIEAGRFHPAISVIGSLSGRSSGRSSEGKKGKGLNALGINRDKNVRKMFRFADEGYTLAAGDAEAYEISIAAAVFKDKKLTEQLLTCSACGYRHTTDEYRQSTICPKCGGKDSLRKFHALFAMAIFPGHTYDQVMASKGTANDLYDKGKRAVFGGLLYGGDERTLERRLGVPIEDAKAGRERFMAEYDGVRAVQKECYDNYCSMRQEGGLGTKVTWRDPLPYVESLQGFRRDFSLEVHIAKTLFAMANKLPLKLCKPGHVLRNAAKGEQTVSGATRSALYAAAFQTQAACMRAALNHKIQSSGAIEIKNLQRRIWDVQPSGLHEWIVAPMNIHDEIVTPTKVPLRPVVDEFIEDTKKIIPLIKIDWKDNIKDWSEK